MVRLVLDDTGLHLLGFVVEWLAVDVLGVDANAQRALHRYDDVRQAEAAFVVDVGLFRAPHDLRVDQGVRLIVLDLIDEQALAPRRAAAPPSRCRARPA